VKIENGKLVKATDLSNLSFPLGGITFIWYILWLFLVYSEPYSHPRISVEEKNYIMSSLMITSGEIKVMKSGCDFMSLSIRYWMSTHGQKYGFSYSNPRVCIAEVRYITLQ
jgi:hypothetical protein